MRQPIIVATPHGVQKRVRKIIVTRIVLATVLVLFYILLQIFLLALPGADPVAIEITWVGLVIISLLYIYMFVAYFRIRHRALPAIMIDEQGIHANKLFIPWDNIAAIFPGRLKKVEYVAVLPRDLRLVLRRSNLNAIQRGAITITAAFNRLRGIPPFGLFSDSLTMQELLQQIWHNYYPEYQRYQISPYPPK